jgi:AAA+ superfamily predicted ATPase
MQNTNNAFPRSASPQPATLVAALGRIDALLGAQLARVRRRGRSGLGDPLRSGLIEDAEAEGLLTELASEPPIKTAEARTTLPRPATLSHAARTYGLDDFEVDVLLLGLGCELDERRARLVAYLNDDVTATRPTVGLTLSTLWGGSAETGIERFLPVARLLRHGLLSLDGDGPLSTRPLVLDPEFWPRLLGDAYAAPPLRFELNRGPRLDELVLDPAFRDQLRVAAHWLAERARRVVVLSGKPGTGRDTLAVALALELGYSALLLPRGPSDEAKARDALRDARWYNAVAVFRPGEGAVADALPVPKHDDNAFLIVSDRRCAAHLQSLGRSVIEIDVPPLTTAMRASLWQRTLRMLEPVAAIDVQSLADRFRYGPGRIELAAHFARSHARVSPHRFTTEALAAACRRIPDVNVGPLAQRLECSFEREDLVLPAETRRELDLALAWARHRSRVLDEWPAGRRALGAAGLTCLFAGVPGTGKTMAAQILARELGLDLYRIDLSQVVSKYIGETEKHLAALFDEAQAAGIALFFDEADALFASRTELHDAHDRYANVETAFLLQRLDGYDGVAILASNLRSNLDDAFVRRVQIIIDFPMPGSIERTTIWKRLLPSAAHEVDVEALASIQLSGGEIRNAVTAAVFAAAEAGVALTMRHAIWAVARELRKSGRIVDRIAFGAWGELLED